MKRARRVHNFGDCRTGKNCDSSNPFTFQALRLKYQIVCWDQSVNQHLGLWEESHALPKEILPIKEITLNSFLGRNQAIAGTINRRKAGRHQS
jgi:hypothetical protein